MIFKRKIYDSLLNWKKNYAGKYAVLLEGARRVGKTTIVREFAEKEYDTFIFIDFASAEKNILDCFDDIGKLDTFFLRLQAITGVQLIRGKSVIVFDEVQLFPKARQAIKYLVADGRYHYIETGSLISIHKNVKDILIPSEEMKLPVYPMDYEEFKWAAGDDAYQLLGDFLKNDVSAGQINRSLMRDFRIYMAVGGMPQAVEAYIEKRNFMQIDAVKREIIHLYEDDFKKIDSSGKISQMFHSIPAQLSKNTKRFVISQATGRKKLSSDERLLYEMIDSKTVLISYNCDNPTSSLPASRDLDSYKLYLADTGLFITLMYIDQPEGDNKIYEKMLADKLPANLGYLYENAVAQTIAAHGRELFYHTWPKPDSSHYYEIDFLLSHGDKVIPVEVKSSAIKSHASLTEFKHKYGKHMEGGLIVSQKDLQYIDGFRNLPAYMFSNYLDSL